MLDHPLERPGAIHRVVAQPGDLVECVVGALERDPRLFSLLHEPLHLNVDDPADMPLVERVEDDRLVDPVQKLREESGLERILHGIAHLLLAAPLLRDLLDRLAADVARHHDDRIRKVHRVAEAVGQPAVVEHLQEHVEHVAVGLLHFVEQYDGVGPSAHGLREQPALLVSDVARGSPDQAGDSVLLHELAHVDPHHRVFIVEEHLGERLAELRLAHARRPQKDERTDRSIRILKTGPAAPHRVTHRLHRLLLADHPLVEPVFEHQELGPLGLHEPRHRDPGPGAHHLRDLLGAHLPPQEPLAAGLHRVLALFLAPLLLQP